MNYLLPASPLTFVFSGLLLIILFHITKSIYRLTLHPLAKYPGPFFSRISSLSIPLQAATGDRHLLQLAEHRRYGSLVRIGPNSLSFSSPSALRQIYQSSRLNNQLRKSDYYKTVDAPAGAYSTHTEISRRKHAFRRRVLDQGFSDASMRDAESFIVENIEIFCNVLGDHVDETGDAWGEAKDMSDYATWLKYDIMGDLVFGKRFGCLTSAENRYVPKLITGSSELLYWVSHLPLQFIVRPTLCSPTLMNWFGGEMARAEHDFVAYAADCVKERIRKENEQDDKKTGRKDMMHYIINAKDPETDQPFTSQDLDAESSLLIAAGADTSSTVLAAAFFYLTLPSSKPVLDHLQKQLRTDFSGPATMTWSEIKKNAYLRAVVEETLRLAPAAPSELPRTILQEPGLEIAGEFVPAGTTVGCSAYVLHHDEDAYPDSFSFMPERWIANTPEDTDVSETHLQATSSLQNPEQVTKAKEAFCAFSLGSRGCVGKTLAYIELCLTLAHVLWTFDIRRAQKGKQMSIRPQEDAKERKLEWREDEYQLKDVFITDRAGPLIEFRRWCSQPAPL